MFDTQDAQVMPLMCTKHFCGAAVPGDGGVSDEWPGSRCVGSLPVLEAMFCADTGGPPMLCGTDLPELTCLTGLTGRFSIIKCEK